MSVSSGFHIILSNLKWRARVLIPRKIEMRSWNEFVKWHHLLMSNDIQRGVWSASNLHFIAIDTFTFKKRWLTERNDNLKMHGIHFVCILPLSLRSGTLVALQVTATLCVCVSIPIGTNQRHFHWNALSILFLVNRNEYGDLQTQLNLMTSSKHRNHTSTHFFFAVSNRMRRANRNKSRKNVSN